MLTVPELRKREKTRHGKKWPTAFRLAGWPGGRGTGEAPTAEAERLCWWTASHYFRALARACVHVVSECVPTRRVLSTSPAGWGMAGKDGPALSAWLEGRLLQLALAYSVAISSMLCSVAVSDTMLPTVPNLRSGPM